MEQKKCQKTLPTKERVNDYLPLSIQLVCGMCGEKMQYHVTEARTPGIIVGEDGDMPYHATLCVHHICRIGTLLQPADSDRDTKGD